MVRSAMYVIDDRFFSISALNDIVRNEEDHLHEPLCVPDDPLGTINVYPMEDIQLLLGSSSFNSPPTIKYEDTRDEGIGVGASKEKREKSIKPTEIIKTTRRRGRPRKNIGVTDSSSTSDLCKIEVAHSRDIPKRRRSRKIIESSSSMESLDSESSEFENCEKPRVANHSCRRLKKRSGRWRQTNSWSQRLPVLALEGPDAPKHSETIRRCSYCRSQSTPQWRSGPNGAGTLCNACGIKYKAGRLAF